MSLHSLVRGRCWVAGGWWTGSPSQKPLSGVWRALPASPCTSQLSHWASQRHQTHSPGHITHTSAMEARTSLSLLTDHLGLYGQDMVGSSKALLSTNTQCSALKLKSIGRAFAVLYLFQHHSASPTLDLIEISLISQYLHQHISLWIGL